MDKPCVHVFAECPDECTSYLYRATEITARARRELRDDSVVRFAGMTVGFMALIFGLLVLVATIYPQAARQWHATIIANQEP